jgi:hypothetical protein
LLYYLTYHEAIESHDKIVVHTKGLISKSNLHYILDTVQGLGDVDVGEKHAIVGKSAYMLYQMITLPFSWKEIRDSICPHKDVFEYQRMAFRNRW